MCVRSLLTLRLIRTHKKMSHCYGFTLKAFNWQTQSGFYCKAVTGNNTCLSRRWVFIVYLLKKKQKKNGHFLHVDSWSARWQTSLLPAAVWKNDSHLESPDIKSQSTVIYDCSLTVCCSSSTREWSPDGNDFVFQESNGNSFFLIPRLQSVSNTLPTHHTHEISGEALCR